MNTPTTTPDSGRSTMATLAYKILEHIQDRKFNKFDFADLDELEDMVKTAEPELHRKFESDNYDGPTEPYYEGDGSFAANH